MLLVYVLRNKINGKYYVGQTRQPFYNRMRDHCHSKKSLIGRALRKYGEQSFEQTLFECINNEHQNFMESDLIKRLSSKFPQGYNLTDGGEGTTGLRGHTAWNKGITWSDETREKISKTLTGRKQSEETKKKYNRHGEKNSFYGRKQTPESKEKMRLAKLGTKQSEETKKKRSESMKGKNVGEKNGMFQAGENHPFWGRHQSAESIAKMKETKRLRLNSN